MKNEKIVTDIIEVETSDHARLRMKISYNWRFDLNLLSESDRFPKGISLFSVADFVGDACNLLASRIRGNVSSVEFDDFHKHSATIIQAAVFGRNKETKEIRDKLIFKDNCLVISAVDIQSIDPVDETTKESLLKSVQLAIEITTNSQEQMARQDASRQEQVFYFSFFFLFFFCFFFFCCVCVCKTRERERECPGCKWKDSV